MPVFIRDGFEPKSNSNSNPVFLLSNQKNSNSTRKELRKNSKKLELGTSKLDPKIKLEKPYFNVILLFFFFKLPFDAWMAYYDVSVVEIVFFFLQNSGDSA